MSHTTGLLKWRHSWKHHSGEAMMFVSWGLILLYDICHVSDLWMDRETLFVCVCVRMWDANVCTCKDLWVSMCKGRGGLEDTGGIGKRYCFLAAGVCMCELASAFFPKNKTIALPSRPYGTDNEHGPPPLLLEPSPEDWKNSPNFKVRRCCILFFLNLVFKGTSRQIIKL